MLRKINLERIFEEEIPLVSIISPNYEDRSVFCIEKIVRYAQENKAAIEAIILYLKNDNGVDAILEGLKRKNYEKVQSILDSLYVSEFKKISYPDNFVPRRIENVINSMLKKQLSKFNLLIDISTMPRQMIFSICEIVYCLLEKKEHNINKVFFSFTTPKEYSSVPYAQEVGMIYGCFSEEPLSSLKGETVHSMIFPGRSGYEGKLLIDNINEYAFENEADIYFPIDNYRYLESLDVMRANPTLMSPLAHKLIYYCSAEHGARILNKQIDRMMKEDDKSSEKVYLVAPFDYVIMLPVAYFALKKSKAKYKTSAKLEICNIKSFQYTSSFSIGVEKQYIFEMQL